MADVPILSVDEYLAKLETQDQREAKETLARKKQHDEQPVPNRCFPFTQP